LLTGYKWEYSDTIYTSEAEERFLNVSFKHAFMCEYQNIVGNSSFNMLTVVRECDEHFQRKSGLVTLTYG